MRGIALVLFDLNGVLYRYDRAARIARLAALANRTAEAVEAAIWTSGFEDLGDAGGLDAEAYLRGFGARLGCDLSEDAWLAANQAAVSPITASLALLPRLRAGVECGVLTNNNLLIQRHFATLYPEVAALVGDRACVSAAFGARKPEPAVYRRCLRHLGVAPEAALFVDDSAANAAGAVAAGLHAHHFTDPDGLEAALHRFGLLVA
ncbi:MAG TPA: HAD-IA family hydrolase [Rhodopila sp.]|uniref:HAD-IA family hydrolase n=1 Tax=Rhodopila sp. TaxID=2480087 RepID=UPI002CCFE1C5|nr:HAD-IA family hydrolase [Rhodopila sp.]HVY15587.1 HAD-IA family hydrolase [Rhodopila sp.]